MSKVSISVKQETKDKIKSLGKMGESYDVVLNKLYAMAVQKQMEHYIMDTEGYIHLEELLV